VTVIDALVCKAPGELVLEKRTRPSRKDRDVLARPRRIGICGTDYHIFDGKHPFLQYPRIMGHELAVEVEHSPTGSPLRPGDICVVNPYLSCGTCIACRKGKPNCCTRISVLGVHQDGGMCEQIVIPESNLIAAPGLSIDACATVGLGVALFARLAGAAQVVLLDKDVERLQQVSAVTGVDGLPLDDTTNESIAQRTDGNGFDIVFDATGNQASMQRGFDFVASGGRYVLVSVVKDQITFSDPDFHRREMTLYGSRNATAEDFGRVVKAIRDGLVPIDQIITHRTSLVDAVDKLPLWAQQKTGLIKALIEIGG
jgi:threonine dehydrogenase-like Zn-dependent dehydrogenase